jgi:hypothetical protein
MIRAGQLGGKSRGGIGEISNSKMRTNGSVASGLAWQASGLEKYGSHGQRKLADAVASRRGGEASVASW